MQRKIRVLVGKPGLDGHDRGAKVVAAALRDAGMEVIYTGLHQTPGQIVEAAVQEDVDVVALSVLSGAHMTLFPEVQRLMNDAGIGDKLLTGGGIIPGDDVQALLDQGIGRLFGPGSSTVDIVAYIRGWYSDKFGADALPPLPPPPARPEPVVGSGDLRCRPSRAIAADDAHHARAAKAKAKPAKKAVKKAPAKKAAPVKKKRPRRLPRSPPRRRRRSRRRRRRREEGCQEGRAEEGREEARQEVRAKEEGAPLTAAG
ncbi:MAG: cobalamin B12-binding domain-containing protein [Candidatus Eisenbacteria bacterium]|nr:cobalamin B12-binding domain-containing protein [Candidatus Eisenbacteria bacterium]